MRELFSTSPKPVHPLAWVVEPLEDEPTFLLRPMFGGKAVYLHGRFVLYLTAKQEPWRGVLLPTLREHHASLCSERPAWASHPVLGKWLYLPEAAPGFEKESRWAVERIRARDARFGIEPGSRVRAGRRGNTQSRQQG